MQTSSFSARSQLVCFFKEKHYIFEGCQNCVVAASRAGKSGPARGFGYTVSWAFLIPVYGIFGQNLGIKYLVFPEF